MGKRALILGSGGQDGTFMRRFLEASSYEVYGVRGNGQVEGLPFSCDITAAESVHQLLDEIQPDEIYHFATLHNSSEQHAANSRAFHEKVWKVNFQSLLHLLEWMRENQGKSRLFFAASSRMYTGSGLALIREDSPVAPTCLYGLTKAAGMEACRFYRRAYRIPVSVGILFNHESSLRAPQFLSKKVIKTALDIKKGLQQKLTIGSFSSRADWGYAPEYVEAMHRMLQQPSGQDYILATGNLVSVESFVQWTFDFLGLDPRTSVVEDPQLIQGKPVELAADIKKIRTDLGWEAEIQGKALIRKLIEDEGGRDYLHE